MSEYEVVREARDHADNAVVFVPTANLIHRLCDEIERLAADRSALEQQLQAEWRDGIG